MEPFKRKIYSDEIWQYKNPTTKDYVSGKVFLTCTLIIPLTLIVLNFLYSRNRRDFCQALYSFTLAFVLCAFLTSLLKVSVGRPRPDFLQRCFPDGVITDLNNCTGHLHVVNEGRKSFPSGHSSMAFSSLSFMFYYLAGKLHIFNQRGRANGWRLCLSLSPLIIALEIAVSRTCDYHHHWEDVLVGSLMGICVSFLCYRNYFPSIFDQQCHKPYPLFDERITTKPGNGFIPVKNGTKTVNESQI